MSFLTALVRMIANNRVHTLMVCMILTNDYCNCVVFYIVETHRTHSLAVQKMREKVKVTLLYATFLWNYYVGLNEYSHTSSIVEASNLAENSVTEV